MHGLRDHRRHAWSVTTVSLVCSNFIVAAPGAAVGFRRGHRGLTAFFRQAREHLTERGRLLIFFGTSGDLAFLEKLMDDHGFARELVARHGMVKVDWQVDYFTYRSIVAEVRSQPRHAAANM
jgi:hypothetical protein